jgi:hypothetical protein
MKPLLRLSAAFLLGSLSFVPVVAAQQHPGMPAGMTHEPHMAQMKKETEMKQHGQMAMGFDQDKATHHFTLTATGGAIAVDANDPADQVTLSQIRVHLEEIAAAFGRGDFEKPLTTHGEVPPGVSGLQGHKDEIAYTFERTERGGIVRMTTSNADARSAIHDFLRYQIKEHATGDAVSVRR